MKYVYNIYKFIMNFEQQIYRCSYVRGW